MAGGGLLGQINACGQVFSDMPPFKYFKSPDIPQFLIFGHEGAGKTTMLYRLRIMQWKPAEIKKDLEHMRKSERDPGYHYEEFTSQDFPNMRFGRIGMWDIPGNEMMLRMWPMFYQYLTISGVFFVVNASEEEVKNVDKMDEVRQRMWFLLNEDFLRVVAFILILNVHEEKDKHKSVESKELRDAVKEMLSVEEIKSMPAHRDRFKCYEVNCSELERDESQWHDIMEDVYQIHMTCGEYYTRQNLA